MKIMLVYLEPNIIHEMILKEMYKSADASDNIELVAVGDVEREINNFDIMMLTPQLSIQKTRLYDIAYKAGKRYGVLKPSDFATLNGQSMMRDTRNIFLEGK